MIFSKGVGYIGRLLKGQIKLVKTVPIDKRLNANFLGVVEIGNPAGVSDKVLQEIQKVQNFLQSSSLSSSSVYQNLILLHCSNSNSKILH